MRYLRQVVPALALITGLVMVTGFGSATPIPAAGPAAGADCTAWSSEWRHPDLHLVFESRTCDWSSSDDRIEGRFYNGENRPLKIEGRVWTTEPVSCSRGANEVMYFYQTIPSGGYSDRDFTIQPRGRQLWICATLARY